MASFNLFALRDFARLARPSSLPPSVLLLETPSCLAVFDAFPKAKYHFLVLPRLPFAKDRTSGRAGDNGEDAGGYAGDAVPLRESDLDNLANLLAHPRAREVLTALQGAADEVVEMVRDEMSKTEGREWGVNVGFHSVPSMRHLHLHIISDDLISPTLKTKKHYNSFRPDLGFFLSLREVMGWLDLPERELERKRDSLKAKEPLLKSDLTCFKCGKTMANIPALKRHLDDEFAAEAKGKR